MTRWQGLRQFISNIYLDQFEQHGPHSRFICCLCDFRIMLFLIAINLLAMITQQICQIVSCTVTSVCLNIAFIDISPQRVLAVSTFVYYNLIRIFL